MTTEQNGKVDVAAADAGTEDEQATAVPESVGEEAAEATATHDAHEAADEGGAIQKDEAALLEPPADEEQAAPESETAPAAEAATEESAEAEQAAPESEVAPAAEAAPESETAPTAEAATEESAAVEQAALESETAPAAEAAPESETAPTAEAATEESAEAEQAAPESETAPAAEAAAEESAEAEPVAAEAETGKERPAEPPAEKPEPAAPKKPRRRKTPLSELKAGTETSGRVVGIAKFGAFVDIGAETDGLVHISELSDKRVNKVEDVVSVGQHVNVWIKDVDTRQERISLSMKPKPKYRLQDLQSDMVVQGTVTGIRDYGAFVDIGAETEGLVHVSEMAEGYVSKPSELVSVGEEIEVRVKDVNRKRRRISLSMKGLGAGAAPSEPEEQEADMPTAMEAAMRRALGELEDEIEDEATEEDIRASNAARDDLSDVYSRMLRDYRDRDDEEA